MTRPRVILVEDETLVALMMEDLLAELGFEIVASFSAVGPALAWLASQAAAPDGALLDVNLGGEMVFPVAEALAERGAPFAFVTGYGALPDDRFADAPLISKPVDPAKLQMLVDRFGRSA